MNRIKEFAWDTVRMIPSFLVLTIAFTGVSFLANNVGKVTAWVKAKTGG